MSKTPNQDEFQKASEDWSEDVFKVAAALLRGGIAMTPSEACTKAHLVVARIRFSMNAELNRVLGDQKRITHQPQETP